MFYIPSCGKFSAAATFVNVSRFFNADWRLFFWLAVRLRLRPEVLALFGLLLSLMSAAAVFMHHDITAFLLLHFADSIDAADGSVARFTNTMSRRGRFLDSTMDFIGVTAIIIALGVRLWEEQHADSALILTIIAWLSIFLECSYYNYYVVRYAELTHAQGVVSRTDERPRDDEQPTLAGERFLQNLYLLFYGWQDWLIARFDAFLLRGRSDVCPLLLNKCILFWNSFFVFRLPLHIILVGMVAVSVTTMVAWYSIVSSVMFALILCHRVYDCLLSRKSS